MDRNARKFSAICKNILTEMNTYYLVKYSSHQIHPFWPPSFLQKRNQRWTSEKSCDELKILDKNSCISIKDGRVNDELKILDKNFCINIKDGRVKKVVTNSK